MNSNTTLVKVKSAVFNTPTVLFTEFKYNTC